VRESGVKDGVVNVLTMHTSSGIIVTEGLPCLEMDVLNHLEALAPDEGDYFHNRYLRQAIPVPHPPSAQSAPHSARRAG